MGINAEYMGNCVHLGFATWAEACALGVKKSWEPKLVHLHSCEDDQQIMARILDSAQCLQMPAASSQKSIEVSGAPTHFERKTLTGVAVLASGKAVPSLPVGAVHGKHLWTFDRAVAESEQGGVPNVPLLDPEDPPFTNVMYLKDSGEDALQSTEIYRYPHDG